MSLETLLAIMRGVPITLFLTAASFALGAVAAIPLAVARRSNNRLLQLPARAVIELFRGIPPIVWLFIIYFGFQDYVLLDPMTASVLGLGVITAAYMAEIYRGGLASISQGQWEAATSLGMSQAATWTRIIGPQVGRVSIPAAATYVIGLIKDTSVAFTIGVTDILYFARAQAADTNDALGPYLVAAAAYVVLTVPCAWGTRALDAKLRRKVVAVR
ncbi:MAG: amino acid ABC transporter permease [Nocardioidaceae bacterium]